MNLGGIRFIIPKKNKSKNIFYNISELSVKFDLQFLILHKFFLNLTKKIDKNLIYSDRSCCEPDHNRTQR